LRLEIILSLLFCRVYRILNRWIRHSGFLNNLELVLAVSIQVAWLGFDQRG